MGINIAFIKRGEIMIKIPTKMSLFPGTKFVLLLMRRVKSLRTICFETEIEILKYVERQKYFTTIRIRQRRTDWKKH
jgi:CPA2 family monovalent cation:H+ antiporter-2